MLSDFEPPSDPEAVPAWILLQEEEIAALVVLRLTEIIDRSLVAFTSTLTAAGDPSVFDSIPIEWSRFVRTELSDRLGGMYLSGGVSAWIQSPGTDALPESTVTAWTDVVNTSAVSYANEATNRLTGPVSDSIWNDLKLKVSKAVETGASTERLAAEIATMSEFATYRAQTIARTEVNGAYNAGNYQSNQALGDVGPVEKYWVATGDDRTRPNHREANGQVRAFSDPFLVGGSEMMYPHDPAGPAKEIVNCRCVVAFLYPGMARPDGSIVSASPETLAREEAGTPSPEQARTFRAIIGEGTPTGQAWIEDVPQFESVDEAERWLTRRWSRTYQGEIRDIRYGNIDLEVAQVFTQDADYLFRTFPGVADNVVKIGSSNAFQVNIGNSLGVASRLNRSLYWNEARHSAEGWTETLARNKRSKIRNWFSTDIKSGTLHHEFGHHIGFEIEAASLGNRDIRMSNEKYFKSGLAPILKRVLGLKGSPGMSGYQTKVAVSKSLSKYGSQDWHEFIAESFAESMAGELNGIEVRPLAQAVREWLDEELRKVAQ